MPQCLSITECEIFSTEQGTSALLSWVQSCFPMLCQLQVFCGSILRTFQYMLNITRKMPAPKLKSTIPITSTWTSTTKTLCQSEISPRTRSRVSWTFHRRWFPMPWARRPTASSTGRSWATFSSSPPPVPSSHSRVRHTGSDATSSTCPRCP